jgi:hypothetical protein
MIEKNKEYQEQILKLKINSVGGIRGLNACEQQKRIAESILQKYDGVLPPQDFQIVSNHIQSIEERALQIIQRDGVASIEKSNEFTTKQKIKLKMELQENYIVKRKNLKFSQQTPPGDVLPPGENLPNWAKNVFVPGLSPKPEKRVPLLKFNNEGFLNPKSISVICAEPGFGKSSVLQCILSNVLNKESDSLGFEVIDEVQKVLYFDCERAFDVIQEGFEKVLQRAKKTEFENKCLLVGLREQYTIEEKKEKILEAIEYEKPQLIFIDGFTDFMRDTNSIVEAPELLHWMLKTCNENNLSILTTIHPTIDSKTGAMKMRGGGGSELLRKCDGVLFIKEKIDQEAFEMFTKKGRSNAKTSFSYKWSEELNDFVSYEIKKGATAKLPLIEALSKEQIEKMVKSIGYENNEKKNFTWSEIINTIQNYIKQNHPGENSGKNAISDFVKGLYGTFINVELRNKASIYSVAL